MPYLIFSNDEINLIRFYAKNEAKYMFTRGYGKSLIQPQCRHISYTHKINLTNTRLGNFTYLCLGLSNVIRSSVNIFPGYTRTDW